MRDVEVEAHADGVGRDDVVDLALLEEFDLLVACFGAQRAHHHCRPAAMTPQHFGDGVDLVGREGDHRAALGQARKLPGARMGQR